MDDEPRYRYRFEYRTLFGSEFTEFTAASDEDAERMFWATRNPELNRIRVVSKSLCNEDGDDGADGGDEDRPADRADRADEKLAQQVLPGGCELELLPIADRVLGACRMDGYPRIKRLDERIKDFLAVHFRKHD